MLFSLYTRYQEILANYWIYFKFRSNNCLDKFNRKFKDLPNMEKYCKGIYFIDNIIEEISTHIDILENEMKKILN